MLGNAESPVDESFETGLLEYPQFTRPPVFRGAGVPEALLSGNHERIRRWRRWAALQRTKKERPDLLARLKAHKAELLAMLRPAPEAALALLARIVLTLSGLDPLTTAGIVLGALAALAPRPVRLPADRP